MDDPRIHHVSEQADASVWPPAPKGVDLSTQPPTFHIPEGRGYVITQMANMIITVLYSFTLLWCARTASEDAFMLRSVAYLIHTLALIVTAISFLVHVYQVAKAARSLNDNDPAIAPIKAIGWFFAPILNSYMPWQILQTIWKRSAVTSKPQRNHDSSTTKNSPLISTWWCTFLIYVFSVIIQNVLARYHGHVSSLMLTRGAGNALFSLIPAFLSIKMVQAFRERQQQSAKTLGSEIAPCTSAFQGLTKEGRKTDEPPLFL